MILSFFRKCHNTCISIFFKVNDAGQLEMHQAAKPAEGAKTDGPFPQTLVIIFVHSQLKYYLKGQEKKKKKPAFIQMQDIQIQILQIRRLHFILSYRGLRTKANIAAIFSKAWTWSGAQLLGVQKELPRQHKNKIGIRCLPYSLAMGCTLWEYRHGQEQWWLLQHLNRST